MKKYKLLGFYVQGLFVLKDMKTHPPSIPIDGILSVKGTEISGYINNAFGIADIRGNFDSNAIDIRAIYGKTWKKAASLGPVIIQLKKETENLSGGWMGTWRLENQANGEDWERDCTLLCMIFPI